MMIEARRALARNSFSGPLEVYILLIASCHLSASSFVVFSCLFSVFSTNLHFARRSLITRDSCYINVTNLKQSTPSDLMSKDKDEVGMRSFCSAPFFRPMT